MSIFTEAELAFLNDGHHLARIATVGKDGTPHVTPVGWRLDARGEVIEVGGFKLPGTKKFRDIARTGRAAIVIDDLVSTKPWHPRGIEVRGRAEALDDAGGAVIRIHPERIVSWGLGSARSARDATG